MNFNCSPLLCRCLYLLSTEHHTDIPSLFSVHDEFSFVLLKLSDDCCFIGPKSKPASASASASAWDREPPNDDSKHFAIADWSVDFGCSIPARLPFRCAPSNHYLDPPHHHPTTFLLVQRSQIQIDTDHPLNLVRPTNSFPIHDFQAPREPHCLWSHDFRLSSQAPFYTPFHRRDTRLSRGAELDVSFSPGERAVGSVNLFQMDSFDNSQPTQGMMSSCSRDKIYAQCLTPTSP